MFTRISLSLYKFQGFSSGLSRQMYLGQFDLV